MNTQAIHTGHIINALRDDLNADSQIQFIQCFAQETQKRLENDIKREITRNLSIDQQEALISRGSSQTSFNRDITESNYWHKEEIGMLQSSLDIESFLTRFRVNLNKAEHTLTYLIQWLAEAPEENRGELLYRMHGSSFYSMKLSDSFAKMAEIVTHEDSQGMHFTLKVDALPGIGYPVELSGLFSRKRHFQSQQTQTASPIFPGITYSRLTHELSSWSASTRSYTEISSRKTHTKTVVKTTQQQTTHKRAFVFNGIDSAIDCGWNVQLDVSKGTIGCWVRLATLHKDQFIIRQTESKNDHRLFIGFTKGNEVIVSLGAQPFRVKVNLDLNWHYWSFVYDSRRRSCHIYCDHILVGQSKISLAHRGKGQLILGEANGHYFHGSLAEIYIWNQAFGPSQVRYLLGSKATGPESNLIGAWEYRDGQAFDRSHYQNHGKFLGKVESAPFPKG